MKQATFDTGAEGWTIVNGSGGHDAAGGVGGSGAMTGIDINAEIWAYAAPAAWLGDLSASYGATLSFQLRQKILTSQVEDIYPDVVLRGGGLVLVADAGPSPGTGWTGYSVGLALGQGWKIGSLTGRMASEAEIRAVLADLTALEIRGEFVSGITDDISWLDNVVLSDPGPVLPVPAGWQIAETFDSGLGGWSFLADVAEFRWVPAGGNPGGHAEAVDFSTGAVWYFVAPAAFLGNRKGFYGGELAFALKQSSTASQFDDADVVLAGAGRTLVFDTPANPGTGWTGYSVSLTDSAGWKVGSLSGAAATRADLEAVLGSLQALHIRGEFVVGPDTGGLDSVSLTAAPARVYLLSDPVDQTLIRGYSGLQNALDAARSGRLIEVMTESRIGDAPWTVRANGLTIRSDAPLTGDFVLDPGVTRLTLTGAMDAGIVASAATGNRLTGSDGNNRLAGSDGADTIAGAAGRDTALGGLGDDVIRGGAGADDLQGGSGNDALSGEGDGDRLAGDRGADLLDGGDGNDRLDGGSGVDTLRGGAGDDMLDGQSGNDRLIGGEGADVFVFGVGGGKDRVFDFDPSADRLRLDATLWGDSSTDLAVVLPDVVALVGTDTVLSFAGGDQIVLRGFVHTFLLADLIDLF
jgi:Ca2+-binding RTX toxin-like protein